MRWKIINKGEMGSVKIYGRARDCAMEHRKEDVGPVWGRYHCPRTEILADGEGSKDPGLVAHL